MKWLEINNITLRFLFLSVSICPVPPTVVFSEKVNAPSVAGLKKCFGPQCDKKKGSDSWDVTGASGINTALRSSKNTAQTLIHAMEERKVSFRHSKNKS